MKLLTPISLLFLSGGGAAFVPLAHRQPLATALAARGKNKAQKAAATLVKSAAPPPPVKEATTTVSSTQVEHSLNGKFPSCRSHTVVAITRSFLV